MKRAIIFAAVLMAGTVFAGAPVQAQAATRANVAVVKKVVAGSGSTLRECLNKLSKEQLENCTVITIPCIPGNGAGTPDVETPDSNKLGTPDIEVPDTEKPEKPDNNKPGTPDSNKPGTPDNNKPGTPDNNKPDTENPGGDETQADYHAYVLRVVELVNDERAKAGLNPLTLQKNITAAAQVRAVESEKSFSHTRPNGSSFSTALTEAGVSYRGSGENIAWGQRSPEEVMRGWMNSAGHRANILNAKFTSIGVGYHQNAAGMNYWSQLFTY